MSFSFFIGLAVALCLTLTACNPIEDGVKELQTDYTQGIIGKPKDITSVSTDKMAYQLLAEDEQKVYDQILDCILNHEESTSLSLFEEDEVGMAYEAVMADYGGLFWVNGYAYKTYESTDGEKIGMQFSPTYTMTREERDETQEKIDDVVFEWISGSNLVDDDDYAKAKFVYETLIEKAEYDLDSENNQNIISVFLGGATVCQGYADAANYLFTQLAIPSMIISGTTEGESHAWNMVLLDGEYYYMDVTWGNSSYISDTSEYNKHIDYSYLNITTDELLFNHEIEMSFDLPECTATADNYYRREGRYFDTWDDNGIGMVFSDGYYNGEEFVAVKLADDVIYSQCLNYFIDDEYIFNYCQGITTVNYLEDTDMHVFTVCFPE